MAEQKVKIKKGKSIQTLNKIFLESAGDIALKINAKRIFVYADLINDYKLLKELSKKDEFVFVTRTHKIGSFDSIIVVDIGREFEILASSSVSDIAENLKPEVFEAVLNLSLELASQGG